MTTTRTARGFLLIAVLATTSSAGGCSRKPELDSEQAFTAKEVQELEVALAKRDITKVSTSCVIVTTGLERLPAPMAAQIKRLCFVEAPRLYLEDAIADVKQDRAKHPALNELSCMQLFVGDAFEALAEHPSDDPGLRALVAEYSQLCPAEVAKLGGGT